MGTFFALHDIVIIGAGIVGIGLAAWGTLGIIVICSRDL